VTVADPLWVTPVPAGLVPLAREHRLVVTVEDGVRAGGVGSAVARTLADARVRTPVHQVGLPERFLDHGTRAEVLAACGLTAQDVVGEVAGRVAPEPVAGGGRRS
jgi:1-deoxy-D-xylulose-5-phosphate synthase